jgi:PucR C-terminal helix-turn-helix domain/GGDEF-like domain
MTPNDPLSRLAAEVAAAERDLPRRLADGIRDRIPIYRETDRITAEELVDSCEVHVDFICTIDRRDAARDDRARAIGADRSRAGIPLADVLEAVRLGCENFWRATVEHARRTRAAGDAELVEVAGGIWSASGVFTELIGSGYRDQEELRIIDRQRERYALIETVLSGADQPHATLWEAVDVLGLPRDRPFAVVAVATDGSGGIPTPRIDGRLRREDMESAWLLRSDVELGIVGCRENQLHTLRRTLQLYEVRAGVSPLSQDFAQTPQVVRLARTALAAVKRDGEVLFFADSAIETMAAGAPDIASAITSIVLARLYDLPESERALLVDTARRWFDTGGSAVETARSLFVHPNTVRNRLRRLEELTLRSLSDPRQAAEVYLAVTTLTPSPER